jgi:hypothetical protein
MQPPIKITAIMLDLLEVLIGADDGLDALTLSRRSNRSANRVYVALAGLEYTGWVQSNWNGTTPRDNHRQRLYRLTGTGHVAAGELISAREQRDHMSPAIPRPVIAILRLMPVRIGGAR